jgi:hypothetical protein
MTSFVRMGTLFASLAILLFATTLAMAEKRSRPTKIGEVVASAETVEMFAAIEKGDIAVKLIPKDSTECRVIIENKTKRPLNVKLPEAFAGVPVLAQQAAGGGGNRRSGSSSSSNRNNNNSSQGMGGGMGGMGMGGMGGGMFGLPPEQVGKFKVATVCLDHGKAEPRPNVPYAIKPIESYTTKSGVRELCEMLGTGQLTQRAAQAAAWHLNNEMSWQELTAKRLRHANGASEPYFSQPEIQAGMQIASTAIGAAKQREQSVPTSPTTTDPSALKSAEK